MDKNKLLKEVEKICAPYKLNVTICHTEETRSMRALPCVELSGKRPDPRDLDEVVKEIEKLGVVKVYWLLAPKDNI